MYTAKDPVKTGRITVILIRIWLGSELLDSFASLFTISALTNLGDDESSWARLDLADRLNQVTAIASLAMLIVTAIALLRWIFLTNRNAQTWSDQIAITPGWAMGWFFVPVANLFKPFEGVSATWRATVAPADINSVAVPVILRWWWGLWLATSIWGQIVSRLSLHADTAAEMIASHWATAATALIDIPLAIVLTHIIRRLSAMQSQVLASSDRPIVGDDEPI